MLILKFFGIVLMLWGIIIVYSALFKMKTTDYKDDSRVGASGFIELEIISKSFNKIPAGLAKGIVTVIGFAFVVGGAVIF